MLRVRFLLADLVLPDAARLRGIVEPDVREWSPRWWTCWESKDTSAPREVMGINQIAVPYTAMTDGPTGGIAARPAQNTQ